MLIVLACGSELIGLKIRDLRVSGSFLAIVLAMALLGPAPAVLVGILCSGVDSAITHRRSTARSRNGE